MSGGKLADWALYLDETGTTDPHSLPLSQGITPLFTLAGVALPLDRWRDYDRAYLRLKRIFFAKEIDQSSKHEAVWEIKGTDLFAPRNAKSSRNRAFAIEVCKLIKEFGGKVFGVTFVKSVKEPMPRSSIYTKGLQILAERFDIFLREGNSTGLMILDSRVAHVQKGSGVDYTVATSYMSFIFGNEDGKQLKRIVEAPMFADSGITAGLQIADIVSGLVYTTTYRDKLAPNGAEPATGYLDYRHCQSYWPTLQELVFSSTNLYGTQKIWGLRTLNHQQKDQMDTKLQALADKFKH